LTIDLFALLFPGHIILHNIPFSLNCFRIVNKTYFFLATWLLRGFALTVTAYNRQCLWPSDVGTAT